MTDNLRNRIVDFFHIDESKIEEAQLCDAYISNLNTPWAVFDGRDDVEGIERTWLEEEGTFIFLEEKQDADLE